MHIKINLFPTAKHAAQAQWNLVNSLDLVLNQQSDSDVGQSLQKILRQTRSQARSPQEWVKLFAHTLIEMMTTLHNKAASASQATDHARRERDSLQLEYDSLRSDVQRTVKWYRGQTLALTNERDQAQTQADQLIKQVARLESALAYAQQAHQDEIKCLQVEITDLRRITAEQQLRLNAHNA